MAKKSAAGSRWDNLNRKVIDCERCPRLRIYCRKVAAEKRRAFLEWDYWGRPVPNFGDPKAKLLIVGLAPAAHGANRTGRMFTGDRSGDWLYRALHKFGFATQAESTSADDGLRLINCAITATAHCAPPDNKPLPEEVANCRVWLDETFELLEPRVMLALGQIAFKAIIDQCKTRDWLGSVRPKFAHGANFALPENRWILASYHPSQQNTFTGKLTEPMFDAVFRQARELLNPT